MIDWNVGRPVPYDTYNNKPFAIIKQNVFLCNSSLIFARKSLDVYLPSWLFINGVLNDHDDNVTTTFGTLYIQNHIPPNGDYFGSKFLLDNRWLCIEDTEIDKTSCNSFTTDIKTVRTICYDLRSFRVGVTRTVESILG